VLTLVNGFFCFYCLALFFQADERTFSAFLILEEVIYLTNRFVAHVIRYLLCLFSLLEGLVF
jgi:hypothetical protein